MPQKTRMYLPETPAHIVQPDRNREPSFSCEEDYQFYKSVTQDSLKHYGSILYANRKNSIPFFILLLALQGCGFLHHYPGKKYANTCRGYTYEKCTNKFGKPDSEIKNPDGSLLLNYYSGRTIWSGYGIFKIPNHKEKHVFVLKKDRIIDEYYVIQVREGRLWMCGNISGHGDFCGSWYEKSCNEYNSNNTLLCGLGTSIIE